MLAADELVIRHAAVGQDHGAPCLDPYPRTERKTRSKQHRIEQIAFESDMARHGTVVERARQWRDEVEVTARPALEETAARNFNYDFDLRRPSGFLKVGASS